MKTLHTIVVVSIVVVAALWGCAAALRDDPVIIPAPSVAAQLQCPTGSYPNGRVCACEPGSEWTGSQCVASLPEAPQPDTRHVTTVDLRRR